MLIFINATKKNDVMGPTGIQYPVCSTCFSWWKVGASAAGLGTSADLRWLSVLGQ